MDSISRNHKNYQVWNLLKT